MADELDGEICEKIIKKDIIVKTRNKNLDI